MNNLAKIFLSTTLFVLSVFALTFSDVFAEKVEDLRPTNYVNDFAGVIDESSQNSLNQKLYDLEQQTGNQVSIVTVKSMDGDYIEHFTVKLFEKWKIGNEKLDNGVLVFVSIEDRQMRIEVGYGLEPTLTDGRSSYIINNILKPNFQKNDYSAGLLSATEEIVKILTQGENYNQKDSGGKSSSFLENIFNFLPFLLFFLFAFFEWLAAVLGRTKSWWLGGILGSIVGGIIVLFMGVSLFTEIVTAILALFGFLFDYIVSKNYSQHRKGVLQGPPDWWSGSTWGPGSSTWTRSSGGGSWGGFGGGSSGGGGASGSW